jgi:hypothetical protein
MKHINNAFLTKKSKIYLWTIAILILGWTGYLSTMFFLEYINVFGSRRYAVSPVNPIGVYGQDKYYLLIVFGLLFMTCFILTLVSVVKKTKNLFIYSVFAVTLLTLLAFLIVGSD